MDPALQTPISSIWMAARLVAVLAMQAMPLYTALPTLIEFMVESGWTQAYSQVEEGGSPLLVTFRLFLYLLGVEFCIYWIHRSLHDYKILYQYLHAPHHIYNKGSTLSPFAGKDPRRTEALSTEAVHVNATISIYAASWQAGSCQKLANLHEVKKRPLLAWAC